MEIKQVFIKCHDNDFWSYYQGALYSLYYWYSHTYSEHHHKVCLEDIQTFIQGQLDVIYRLSNEGGKFPWKVTVTLNDEAEKAYENESKWGNHECAYMDIESYLLTPNAQIEQFIFSV